MQPLVAVGSLEGGERCGIDGSEPALEAIGDEAGGTAGDVDVLAHEVAIDLGDEIVEAEVEVFEGAVRLGGEVVAQIFRAQMLEIGAGLDERAA